MLVREWEPVTPKKLACFAFGLGLFMILLLRSEPGFVFVLDQWDPLESTCRHASLSIL